jgi:hypothetical protein
MIMDDECDMCRYSACDHADNEIGSGILELVSMTALHASPLLFQMVQ